MRPSRQSSPTSASSFSFKMFLDFGVRGDHACQRATEALFVHPALVRVDVVGEREDRLVVAGGPLHRDLDLVLLGFGLEVDDPLVDRVTGRIEVLDEVDDPAGVLEGVLLLRARPLVDQADLETLVEERHLAQALGERVELELALLGEDLGVGPERDRRAGALGRLDRLQLVLGLAPLVLLVPQLAVPDDVDLELLREGVHDRDPDAVETTGDLVALPSC